jgi:hypothetical protein
MNLVVKIVGEVCDWYGISPMDFIAFSASTDPEQNRNEKTALSLICHFLTDKDLREFTMYPQEIARYFGINEKKVLIALNQREYWQLNSGSYRVVKGKVQIVIDNYLIKIYG